MKREKTKSKVAPHFCDQQLRELSVEEAVSGCGPGFDLFEDKSPSAFLKMTYPNILVPKFS